MVNDLTSEELAKRYVHFTEKVYGEQLRILNPAASFEFFSYQDLEDLVLEQLNLYPLIMRESVRNNLPVPDPPSLHYTVFFIKHPDLPHLYPQIDPFSLSEDQLERLVRAVFPEEVLGEVEDLILRAKRQQIREDYKLSHNNSRSQGGKSSPKKARSPSYTPYARARNCNGGGHNY
ncbi:MAG: hypothetical protein RL557_912 [archaeon]|jgi:hypothetical protein